MALKLFEFVEQLILDTFLFKLTEFEETGSIGDTFTSLGNPISNIHFRKQKSITFFLKFTLMLFNSGLCPPFHNGNALNLKRNHKSNRKIQNCEATNFKTFS